MKLLSHDDYLFARAARQLWQLSKSLPAGVVSANMHMNDYARVRDCSQDIEKQYQEQQRLRRTGTGHFVIVTRHAGAVEWLAQRGYTGPVIEQATVEDVRGKAVIGNLPMHLAAEAAIVGNIDIPNLTREQRGQDLTPEEMRAAGAVLRWYAIEVQP